jgi:hypothetical protein
MGEGRGGTTSSASSRPSHGLRRDVAEAGGASPSIALHRLNVPSNRPVSPRLSSAGKNQENSKQLLK